jgi:hypothetical protein
MSGGSQVKTLVPVRVQSPLAHACRLGLLAINRSNRERVGKACSCQSAAVFAEDGGGGGGERTEDISLVEPIGCDDCFVCQ